MDSAIYYHRDDHVSAFATLSALHYCE